MSPQLGMPITGMEAYNFPSAIGGTAAVHTYQPGSKYSTQQQAVRSGGSVGNGGSALHAMSRNEHAPHASQPNLLSPPPTSMHMPGVPTMASSAYAARALNGGRLQRAASVRGCEHNHCCRCCSSCASTALLPLAQAAPRDPAREGGPQDGDVQVGGSEADASSTPISPILLMQVSYSNASSTAAAVATAAAAATAEAAAAGRRE